MNWIDKLVIWSYNNKTYFYFTAMIIFLFLMFVSGYYQL